MAVSSGSACSSGKVAGSHVLAAMQVAPTLVSSALRISSGRATAEAEIDVCLGALQRIEQGHAKRKLKSASAGVRQVA